MKHLKKSQSVRKLLPSTSGRNLGKYVSAVRSIGCAACFAQCITFLYELVCLFLAIIDIFSDVLITWNFYQEDARVFFWFSFAILVVAQISYTTLFATLYFAFDWDAKQSAIAWFLVFPFAQAVPFIIWLESFHFRWFDRLFKTLGLKSVEPMQSGNGADGDPMFDYLRSTFQTHGGFLLEAVVEAIPQSILQMTYIVVHQKVGYINVFSITLSLISVASKGVLLSYCLDRLTFVFNIFCFAADVFNIFCTVAFLFFLSPHSTSYSVFFLSTPVNLISSIWFHLQAALWLSIALCLLGFLCFLIGYEIHRFGFWNPIRAGDRITGALFTGLIAMLYAPCMIVLTGIKLSLIPLLVFQTVDSKSARHAELMRNVYEFIREGGFERVVCRSGEMKLRQSALARALAWSEIANSSYGGVSRSRLVAEALLQVPPSHGWDPLLIFRVDPNHTNLFKLWRGALFEARQTMIRQQGYGNRPIWRYRFSDIIMLIGFGFVLYWVLPLAIVNALYSLFYPMICLWQTPLVDMGYLQSTFMAIYVGVMTVCLVLTPHAIRFAVVSYLPLSNYLYQHQLNQAKLMYQSYKARPVVREMLNEEVKLPRDLANLVMSYVSPYEMDVMLDQIGAAGAAQNPKYYDYVQM